METNEFEQRIAAKRAALAEVETKIKGIVDRLLDADDERARAALLKERAALGVERTVLDDEIRELTRRQLAADLAQCEAAEQAALDAKEEARLRFAKTRRDREAADTQWRRAAASRAMTRDELTRANAEHEGVMARFRAEWQIAHEEHTKAMDAWGRAQAETGKARERLEAFSRGRR